MKENSLPSLTRPYGKWLTPHSANQHPKMKPPRHKHNALLAGLLFCESCQRPMIPTYSGKGTRPDRYYVCQGARQNGWKSCSTKSVSATLIEDSLVSQLRIRLSAEQTRLTLKIWERDWQAFVQGETKDFVTKFVERLRYNGMTGTVSGRAPCTPESNLPT